MHFQLKFKKKNFCFLKFYYMKYAFRFFLKMTCQMFYIIHVVTKVKLYLKSDDKKQNPDNYKRV